MVLSPAFPAARLPATAVSPARTLGTRHVLPAALAILSVSAAILPVPPIGADEEGIKAPDMTDYTSMYEDPVAEASVPSLYGQIREGTENRHLECSSPDHLLVLRHSLRLACVTAESASRAGWPEVGFTDDNDTVVNSTLNVDVDGEAYVIDYVLIGGLVESAWEGTPTSGLFLKVITADGGKMSLEIPKSFYTWAGPDVEVAYLHVHQDWRYPSDENPRSWWFNKTIMSDYRGQHDGDLYSVEFSFTDPEPEIGIMLSVPIGYLPAN